MRDLVRNALRRNLQMARVAGDIARADRLERLLNPAPVAVMPAAVVSRRAQKEAVAPPPEVEVTVHPEAQPVELAPDAPVEE
jgi:hypothetical protein